MNCDPCDLRGYRTEAVEQIPGFNKNGRWSWALPVCDVHAGRGVVACEHCESEGVIRPAVVDRLCDNCHSAQGELQSERRLEA